MCECNTPFCTISIVWFRHNRCKQFIEFRVCIYFLCTETNFSARFSVVLTLFWLSVEFGFVLKKKWKAHYFINHNHIICGSCYDFCCRDVATRTIAPSYTLHESIILCTPTTASYSWLRNDHFSLSRRAHIYSASEKWKWLKGNYDHIRVIAIINPHECVSV